MTRATLLALADRVEALTGPCRETDERIGMAIGLKQTMRVGHECLGTYKVIPIMCPRYTASLDAAMALVPEGWHTKLAVQDRHSHSWGWTMRGGYGVDAHGRAATEPLARTAAALRARAMMENSDDR